MIILACGCEITQRGNYPDVKRCERHESEEYRPADWKGYTQKRGPDTERHDWMEQYDNYG